MTHVPSKADAIETIRFAIFDALISQMPAGSYPFLEQAAQVAAGSLDQPHFAWALEMVAAK